MAQKKWDPNLDEEVIRLKTEMKQGTTAIARKLGYAQSTIRRHLIRLGLVSNPIRKTAHDPCVICLEPVLRRDDEDVGRYNSRHTCGKHECRLAINRLSNTEKAVLYKRLKEGKKELGKWEEWMYIEKPFAKHNIKVKPDRSPMISKPDQEISSYMGTGMALVVEK